MKRKFLILITISLTSILFGCSKSEILREENSFSVQTTKARPESELAIITGRINPADVQATVYAWNEMYTSEPVAVTEKEGTFTLTVPALDYYHLTISYETSTGEQQTYVKPKVIVNPNAVTDVGQIDLP